jgi:hypothetical protein
MERNQIHAARPLSGSTFSVWGAWDATRQNWACVCVSSDSEMTGAYQHYLEQTFTKGTAPSRTSLVKHWSECTHHLYHLGLNSTRLIVRDGLKQLDCLVGTIFQRTESICLHQHEQKYQNIAKPRTGAAHVCLMYMNHPDYQRRLLHTLRMGFVEFPATWSLARKPFWTKSIDGICKKSATDIRIVHSEAYATRELVSFGPYVITLFRWFTPVRSSSKSSSPSQVNLAYWQSWFHSSFHWVLLP